MYNCVIIDDNLIDRLTVVSYVKKYTNFTILADFENPELAIDFIQKNKVDILFLDIDMPEKSGKEVRKILDEIPVCVFITSYPDHAVDTFELDTLDFIVKPLSQDRFVRTVSRINDYLEIKNKVSLFDSHFAEDVITIKEGTHELKIKIAKILYLEGLKDYTKIVTEERKYCVLKSIGNLLKEECFQTFIRIHKSYAVQKQFIGKKTSTEVILFNQLVLPLGRSYKENLQI